MKRNKLKRVVENIIKGMDLERDALYARLARIDEGMDALMEIYKDVTKSKKMQKPFKKVWKKFKKTLGYDALHIEDTVIIGRDLCKTFYNYDILDLSKAIHSSISVLIERHVFIPFLEFIKCNNCLVNNKKAELTINSEGFLHANTDGCVFNGFHPNRTIQRIKP